MSEIEDLLLQIMPAQAWALDELASRVRIVLQLGIELSARLAGAADGRASKCRTARPRPSRTAAATQTDEDSWRARPKGNGAAWCLLIGGDGSAAAMRE